ncbi:MAG: hypothetical protein V3S48_01690 [Candidatus Neomarinimicrobiota bacterium]
MNANINITRNQAARGGSDLKSFISQRFFLAARLKHSEATNFHPLILLNAIKNIIGDQRHNPSTLLLKEIEDLSRGKTVREDDNTILNQVAKAGLGKSIFIMDMEDACQAGNLQLMEQEAARLHWASENGSAALEILIELALQDFEKNGILAFHLQRACAFAGKNLKTWRFTRTLLIEMGKESLPEPHLEKDLNPWIFMGKILNIPQPHLWVKYSVALRLWQGEYTRAKGYRREISHWLDNLSLTGDFFDLTGKLNDLKSYVENGGTYFIKLGESLLKNETGEKLSAVEALRYLANNCPRPELRKVARAIEILKEL